MGKGARCDGATARREGGGGQINPLLFVPSRQRLCRNMKIRLLAKRERRSGGKDLERQPLTGWIQGRQLYEDIRF